MGNSNTPTASVLEFFSVLRSWVLSLNAQVRGSIPRRLTKPTQAWRVDGHGSNFPTSTQKTQLRYLRANYFMKRGAKIVIAAVGTAAIWVRRQPGGERFTPRRIIPQSLPGFTRLGCIERRRDLRLGNERPGRRFLAGQDFSQRPLRRLAPGSSRELCQPLSLGFVHLPLTRTRQCVVIVPEFLLDSTFVKPFADKRVDKHSGRVLGATPLMPGRQHAGKYEGPCSLQIRIRHRQPPVVFLTRRWSSLSA